MTMDNAVEIDLTTFDHAHNALRNVQAATPSSGSQRRGRLPQDVPAAAPVVADRKSAQLAHDLGF